MRLSRGFLCATFGIAMTLFSWYSPWAWPAWPALTTMRLLVGTQANFADLSFRVRGVFVVLLIVINLAVWAGAALLVWWFAQCLTARRRPPPAS